mmetsp:Transcript_5874/g.17553  ORF Transcript_5874/g.17553 Transcript_5874/m.17553 type:complete len:138 (-) Transcript_5874:263-676(-)
MVQGTLCQRTGGGQRIGNDNESPTTTTKRPTKNSFLLLRAQTCAHTTHTMTPSLSLLVFVSADSMKFILPSPPSTWPWELSLCGTPNKQSAHKGHFLACLTDLPEHHTPSRTNHVTSHCTILPAITSTQPIFPHPAN